VTLFDKSYTPSYQLLSDLTLLTFKRKLKTHQFLHLHCC